VSDYRRANPEVIRARKAAHYKANREAIAKKGYAERRLPENIEAKRAYDHAYNQANGERQVERVRQWREANRGKKRAQCAKRKAGKRNRTPAWADKCAIDAVYEACPPGHQVDHIIPLQGKRVSGLHVAGNLQHLDSIENQEKHNHYKPAWEILIPGQLTPPS